VPLAFPSHQGLIAPIYRRWPHRFAPLECAVGAAAPDVVDGVLSPVARGELGQWLGHSLLGSMALDVPLALGLVWLVATAFPKRARRAERMSVAAFSAWFGSVSHLFFDFVSHGNFLWALPWYDDPRFFPSFWYAEWTSVDLFVYPEPYPIGPHFLVWALLSVLGVVMFFRRPSR
jgi:hypothetical protein